ncbi:MAG: hypothetical protein D3926_03690 [Desulfobacteraceae bacterium]|nr:MAG: hypothetical protein D3926_03690 [Desulfobacteraceae bacterium]
MGQKRAFNIGVRLEETGDSRAFLIASPEKALSDLAAGQAQISNKREMEEFLKLLRLDFSVCSELDFTLMDKIKEGYRRQSLKLLFNCLKESHV